MVRPNAEKAVFDTAFRYERIITKSSVSFFITSFSFPTIVIPHNLGYSPYFKLWYSFDNNNYIYPCWSGPSSYDINSNAFQIDDIYADSANIYISCENLSLGTLTGKFYVRIYEERVL